MLEEIDPAQAKIIVLALGQNKPYFLHGREWLIGALANPSISTIVYHKQGVSREHVRIVYENKRYYLIDVSRWGTWINGEKILSKRLLQDGDVIGLCNAVDRDLAFSEIPQTEDPSNQPQRMFTHKKKNTFRINGKEKDITGQPGELFKLLIDESEKTTPDGRPSVATYQTCCMEIWSSTENRRKDLYIIVNELRKMINEELQQIIREESRIPERIRRMIQNEDIGIKSIRGIGYRLINPHLGSQEDS